MGVTATLLCALALIAGRPVRGQASDPLPRATPTLAGLRPAPLAESTALLQQFVDGRKTAGAVAMLAHRGALVHTAAVGYQDLATHVPMSERTIFRIYSMTKPVTAVAVMMLVEERLLSLDDPVSRYLPEFADVRVIDTDGRTRAPARPVTVRDLLLHVSGLNHRTSEAYRAAQVRSRAIALPVFVRNITRVPLMEDPGTRYRYSESTTVLGRLVEVCSGQAFDAFLAERVFRPLRMVDTGFFVTQEQRARLATVYAPADDGLREMELETVPFTERPALLEGAVGLVSTAPDFLRFSQMLLNLGVLDGVRLLQADTVASMVENGLSAPVLAARGGVMGWGLANVNVVLQPDRLRYPANRGEYGWDGTAGTIFWNDPTTHTAILLFTQNSPPDPDNLRQRFKTVVQRAMD
jgi:CubicO group peptidase (beta-lactamase class C family)